MMDIIDRLNNPKMYVDAIDDAIKEIKSLRLNLEGHQKANVQLKEDLQLESVAYKTLRARLEEWQERAARNQGETIRLLRDKAALWDALGAADLILQQVLDMYPDVVIGGTRTAHKQARAALDMEDEK